MNREQDKIDRYIELTNEMGRCDDEYQDWLRAAEENPEYGQVAYGVSMRFLRLLEERDQLTTEIAEEAVARRNA